MRTSRKGNKKARTEEETKPVSQVSNKNGKDEKHSVAQAVTLPDRLQNFPTDFMLHKLFPFLSFDAIANLLATSRHFKRVVDQFLQLKPTRWTEGLLNKITLNTDLELLKVSRKEQKETKPLSVDELLDEVSQYIQIPFLSDRLTKAQAQLKEIMSQPFNKEDKAAVNAWRKELAKAMPKFPFAANIFSEARRERRALFHAKKALTDFDKDEEMHTAEHEKQRSNLEDNIQIIKRQYEQLMQNTLAVKDSIFIFQLTTSRMSGMLEYVKRQLIINDKGVVDLEMLERIKKMAHIWNYNELRLDRIKKELIKLKDNLEVSLDSSKLDECKKIIDQLFQRLKKGPEQFNPGKYKQLIHQLDKHLEQKPDPFKLEFKKTTDQLAKQVEEMLAQLNQPTYAQLLYQLYALLEKNPDPSSNSDVYLQAIDEFFKRLQKKKPDLSNPDAHKEIIDKLFQLIRDQRFKQIKAQLKEPMKFVDDESGEKKKTFKDFYKIKPTLETESVKRAIKKINEHRPPAFLLSEGEDAQLGGVWTATQAALLWGFTDTQLDQIFYWQKNGKGAQRYYLTSDLLAARLATPWTKKMKLTSDMKEKSVCYVNAKELAYLQQHLPEVVKMMVIIKDSWVFYDESHITKEKNMRWEKIRHCAAPDGGFLKDKFKKTYPKSSVPTVPSYTLPPKSESAPSKGSTLTVPGGMPVQDVLVQAHALVSSLSLSLSLSLPPLPLPVPMNTGAGSASSGGNSLPQLSLSQQPQAHSVVDASHSHSHSAPARGMQVQDVPVQAHALVSSPPLPLSVPIPMDTGAGSASFGGNSLPQLSLSQQSQPHSVADASHSLSHSASGFGLDPQVMLAGRMPVNMVNEYSHSHSHQASSSGSGSGSGSGYGSLVNGISPLRSHSFFNGNPGLPINPRSLSMSSSATGLGDRDDQFVASEEYGLLNMLADEAYPAFTMDDDSPKSGFRKP